MMWSIAKRCLCACSAAFVKSGLRLSVQNSTPLVHVFSVLMHCCVLARDDLSALVR